MQILKEEIREKILSRGLRHFFKNGYENASMRGIAESSGITASNIYKYFDSKEALFDAVIGAYYLSFKNEFGAFMAHPSDSGHENPEHIADALFRVISADPERFVILFERSGKSRYGKFREFFTDSIGAHIHDEKTGTDECVIRIVSQNLVRGIIDIAKNSASPESMGTNLKRLFAYHMSGVKALK